MKLYHDDKILRELIYPSQLFLFLPSLGSHVLITRDVPDLSNQPVTSLFANLLISTQKKLLKSQDLDKLTAERNKRDSLI